MGFTTMRDLSSDLAEGLGLDHGAVEAAIYRHRRLFTRYERITDAQYRRLSKAVWNDVTGHAQWPWTNEGAR